MCNNKLYSTDQSNYNCSSGILEPTPVCVPTNINIYKNQYQKCNEYIKDNYAIPAYGFGNLNSETWMSCGAGGNMEKEINNFEQLCNLWYQTFDVTENNNEIDYGSSTDTIKGFINDVCTPSYKPPEKNYTCPVPPNRITWVSPQPYKNQDNITSDMMKCLDKDHIIDDNGPYKCDSNGKLTPTPTCIPVTTGNSDGDSVDSSGNDGSNNEGNCADQPWKAFNTFDKFMKDYIDLYDSLGSQVPENSNIGNNYCETFLNNDRKKKCNIPSMPFVAQMCKKSCNKCDTHSWTRQEWIDNITMPESLDTTTYKSIGADFESLSDWINSQDDDGSNNDDTNNDDTNNDEKCIDQPWKRYVDIDLFKTHYSSSLNQAFPSDKPDTAGSLYCAHLQSEGLCKKTALNSRVTVQMCRKSCDRCTTPPWSRQGWIDNNINDFKLYNSQNLKDQIIGADFESLSDWINEEKTGDTVTPEIENKIAVNKNINLAKSDNTLNSTCKDEPWKVYTNVSDYYDGIEISDECKKWKKARHCVDDRLDIRAACLLSCSSPSPNGHRYININGEDKLCSKIDYRRDVPQKYKNTLGFKYNSEEELRSEYGPGSIKALKAATESIDGWTVGNEAKARAASEEVDEAAEEVDEQVLNI